jgi:hypothetical protein
MALSERDERPGSGGVGWHGPRFGAWLRHQSAVGTRVLRRASHDAADSPPRPGPAGCPAREPSWDRPDTMPAMTIAPDRGRHNRLRNLAAFWQAHLDDIPPLVISHLRRAGTKPTGWQKSCGGSPQDLSRHVDRLQAGYNSLEDWRSRRGLRPYDAEHFLPGLDGYTIRC